MTEVDQEIQLARISQKTTELLSNNKDQGKRTSKSLDLSPLPLADRSNRLSSSSRKNHLAIHSSTSQALHLPPSSAVHDSIKSSSPSSSRRSVSSTSPAPIGSISRSQSARAVSSSSVQPFADGSSKLSSVKINIGEEEVVNQARSGRASASNSFVLDEITIKDSVDSPLNKKKILSAMKTKTKKEKRIGVNDEEEVITPQDRGRSAGGLSITSTKGNLSGRTAKMDSWNKNLISSSSSSSSSPSSLSSHWPDTLSTFISAEEAQITPKVKAKASYSSTGRKLTASNNEDWISKDSAQAMSSGGSDDLASLTQRVNLSDDTKDLPPSQIQTSRSAEGSSDQHGEARIPVTQFNLYQQHPYLPQPDGLYAHQHHQHGFPLPPHPPPSSSLREGSFSHALPTDGVNEQALLIAGDTRSDTISGPGPLDPLPIESHPRAPLAYTGPYGLTMPPLSIGNTQSSPQSPIYGSGHHHQHSADSGVFMYPTHYHPPPPHHPHQAIPSMTAHMMTTNPRNVSSNTSGNISPLQGSMIPSLASGGYMMQQLHQYGPQSPVLVAIPDGNTGHLNQRDLSTNNSIPSGIPSLPQHHRQPSYHQSTTYGMNQQTWGQSQSSMSGSAFALPPSWSQQYEARSPQMNTIGGNMGSRSGHQRVLSNQHAHSINNTMGFMPGSMSPPSSIFRSPMQSGRMGMHSRSPSSFSQFSHPRSTNSEIQRSPLLDEFRSKHNRGRQYELNDIKGSLVEFSSDQYGSRFIQEKLDAADKEDTEMVFEELLSSVFKLMTDVFGNYVIQKLFEHGTDPMRSQLVDRMSNNVLMLSLGTYGCRVVQKALEHVSNEEQMQLVNELRLDILTCARDQNANHVIQKTLERVKPTSQIDFIPTAFRHNVYSLASHCYSCRVLQRIFEHCEESQRRPLIDELLQDAEKLMHDQFGNYVIQWILQYGIKEDKEVVIELAKGNVMKLSRHKFASNVMEQVVRAASQEERYLLIQEALVPIQEGTSTDLQPGAVFMMKDQYANYVLQRFLEFSEGMQKMRLYSIVKPALQNLKRFSTGYAKHLAAIERLLESNILRSSVSTMTTDIATSSSST